ncbi:restriction endonuclease subunit S [Maribacter dokdonensis]|uniref:restriction endonuclease subunit S n=1 Tax=Maribacter dokdonensis TaxID=320912 RepID=UPI002735D863|nr:restriction endonuclease subunit S [Maribacter dokdonensis]MDP2526479.1 restriction endonuclease subunit S [Maribacter dokdonensis]
MGELKKSPEVRFDGFKEDWIEHELSEVIDLNSGRDYKHLAKGSIPVYGTGGYMLSVNQSLSQESDAIGIGRKGTIDKPYILKAPFWTVDTLFYAIPKDDYDLNFINSIFKKINWKEKDESTGVPSLSKITINSIKVITPDYCEQRKIGALFSNIDSLIKNHQTQLTKLKNLKKAMLVKMFPQEGATVPEIRFKGFDGEWEEKCLNNICDTYSGGTPLVGIVEYYNGKIPFIRSGEINRNKTELYISEKGLKESSAKLVEKGTIMYALYGATSGEVGISKLNGAINQAILAIQPYEGYNNIFICEWLKREKSRIISTYLQGGQGNLSGNIIKNLIIYFPCEAEQNKIGTYFKNIDLMIKNHQEQLKKLNNIKKACLNKMFVA